jgi:hypothetical protein
MDKELFKHLVQSLNEACSIVRGKKKPSRVFEVKTRQDDSRADRIVADGVCSVARREVEDNSELGTASPTADRTRGGLADHCRA